MRRAGLPWPPSGSPERSWDLDTLASRYAEIEPWLQAFVTEEGRFARLRRERAALAERYPDPARRPPLFGVAVGVKDIFHVDGFPTQAGSRLPAAELGGAEAESVARLKAAGALIAGKTVTTEFATFAPGPTRNPWNPEHTPGGSSSGSAAAVGAGLLPLALGTQTIGSISRPASFCGVVGFKPSLGRISTAGVIPISPALDHVGTFTPDVALATVAASVLVEGWQSATESRRPVLGVPVGPYLERATAAGLALFGAACERLEAAGFALREVPAFSDFAALEARNRHLFEGEMWRSHAPWFPRHEALYQERTRELLRRGAAVSEDQLAAAREGQRELRARLAQQQDEAGIDLWLSPASTGPAPLGLDATGNPVMNLPWTHAGLPTVALPAGRDTEGLPMGIQLAAGFGADELLLAWAVDLERALA